MSLQVWGRVTRKWITDDEEWRDTPLLPDVIHELIMNYLHII